MAPNRNKGRAVSRRLTMVATFVATMLCAIASARADDRPTLRLATLEGGTVSWELDTIRHYGLDEKHGFTLEVRGMAGNPATRIAFQGGEADSMVADWLWVARQRAEGRDYVFIPYSTAVGGLVVPQDSLAETLADLAGGKIGIAGGPTDKSWLLLRAYATQEYGLDLAAETEQVFGAPPLIYNAGLSGQVDGAINFWHFLARMKAAGMREVISVADAAAALGLDPEIPMLGYVVTGDMARDNAALIEGFAAASREAKAILAEDDAAWERLRPMMPAETDAAFHALVEGFRAGIPGPDPVDEAAAAQVYSVLAELGGEDLVGSAMTLPEGVFWHAH